MSNRRGDTTPRAVVALLLSLIVLAAAVVVDARECLAVRLPVAETSHEPQTPGGRCVDGSQIVRLTSGGVERLLTANFVAACDPAVSFDGEQILFSGRRSTAEDLQVWRMNRDGGDVVRITNHPGDATSPLWIGSLFHLDDQAPTDRIAFLGTGHGWIDDRNGTGITALYAADLDGANARRISFHLASDLAPDVLANGRLIFPTWRPGSDGAAEARLTLMAVNNDGTDLMAFHDNHRGPALPHAVRVGLDGRTYFVEADGRSPYGGGDLAYVTLRRPLRSRALLAVAGGGAYLDPLPLADGGLLVSYRAPGGRSYGLYEVDPATGDRRGVMASAPDVHYLDAQELAPHPRVQGRSSVVDVSQETGSFFCISSHISDRPGLDRLHDAAVTLRVVGGAPAMANATQRRGIRILGEVPLEEDGSFHIEVPANTPVSFEILDAEGTVVARQKSWTWVMPKEKRGCIGCHEDREMVAPNKLADAVVKPAVRFDAPEEVKEP